MPNHTKAVIEAEDLIDDRCVELILLQGRLKREEIKIVDNAVYIGKKHIASVMKRHCDSEEQQLHLDAIYAGLNVPVKELLILKQHYRIRARFNAVLALIWFLVAISSIAILGHVLSK